ncbi:MAG: hypothetical protein ACRDS9_04830 [Pseudonocardiaceae bacterium]
MTLITLTVVVIMLLIAVLAIFLFTIGGLLNRTADNLNNCLQNTRTIANQANVIVPAIERINQTGKELVGALPGLHELAQHVETAPASAPSEAPPVTPPQGVGYLDT